MTEQPGHDPYRVVFVCTGNTCRSPMAEGILRKLAADNGLGPETIESLSAGTMGMVGVRATQMAVEVAAQYGVDIKDHQSQGATRKLLLMADLVLALASDHLEYCQEIGVPDDRCYLLRDFPDQSEDTRFLSVPDPIGRARDVYQEVFFQIDEALRRSLPEIVKRAEAKTGSAEA